MINFFKKHKPFFTVIFFFIILPLIFLSLVLDEEKEEEQDFLNKSVIEDSFENSYKEKISQGKDLKSNILFDEQTNIYTNLLYNITIDFPNNWEVDMGTTKNSVVRGVEKDSGLVMSFIPIELKKDTKMYELQDELQNMYESNKAAFNKIQKDNIENLTGVKVDNFSTSTSYLKNQPTIRSQFNHILKDLDFEYEITTVMHQYWRAPYSITLAINIPSIWYNENPDKYNDIFTEFNFAAPQIH